MFTRVHSRGMSRIPSGIAGVVTVCLLLLACGVGCSRRGKALAKIRDALAKNDYEETMVLSEHALRNGVQDAKVYFYYGVALIEGGSVQWGILGEFSSFFRSYIGAKV